MKLRIFLTVMTFMTAFIAKAQDISVATLQRNGDTNFQTFYGADSFKQALDNAIENDIITLSAGIFTATDITKAVQIYGAGFELDPSKNKYISSLVGNFKIDIANSKPGLLVEGIYHDGIINVNNTIEQAAFRSCRFNDIKFNGRAINTLFEGCRVADVFDPDSCSQGLIVRNSIINNIGSNRVSGTNLSFLNCVIFDAYNQGVSASFMNSWIYKPSQSAYCSYYNNVIYKSYGINTNNESRNRFMDYYRMENMFTSPSTSYSDSNPYTLTESASSEYLGTDGKQVGIYGGSTPYRDTPSTPQITNKEIGTATNKDGKLSVKITVNAQ